MHRRDIRRSFVGVLILTAGLLLTPTASANPPENQFEFLIKKGRDFITATDGRGLTVSVATGLVVPVQGNLIGTEAEALGTARVTVWTRNVPGSFQQSFQPLAVLIVVDFFQEIGLRAHFSLIETPLGRQAAIGAGDLDAFGRAIKANRGLRGSWSIQERTVPGQTSKDLLIKGAVVMGGFSLLPRASLTLVRDTKVAGDASPVATHPLPGKAGLAGSFFGHTILRNLPAQARSYISSLAPAAWAHLMAIHASADNYVIVACSATGTTTPVAPLCTLSGTGASYSAISGSAAYTPGAKTTSLSVSPSVVQ